MSFFSFHMTSQELEVLCLSHSYTLKTKESQCHYEIPLMSFPNSGHFSGFKGQTSSACDDILPSLWLNIILVICAIITPMVEMLNLKHDLSCHMTKPTKWLQAQRRLRSAWASPSLIRVFAVRMKKPWVRSYPLSTQRRLWSDWADAQADLSLRWVHTDFVGFVMSWLH